MKAKEEAALTMWDVNILLQQRRRATQIGPGRVTAEGLARRRNKWVRSLADKRPSAHQQDLMAKLFAPAVEQTEEYGERLCRRALQYIRTAPVDKGRAPGHIQLALRHLFRTDRERFNLAVAEREKVGGRMAMVFL